MLLEIICCSLADAQAAADGGADRLEVCSRLDLQGLTPPLELVETIERHVVTPVRVMIRVNDHFTATEAEIAAMEDQVRALAHLPIDGVIFGLHDASGRLDFASMDRVLQHAPLAWGWTLHRAFDYAAGSAEEKIAAVHRHGRADRILTGDCWQLTPPEGLLFVAGGGLSAENLHFFMDSPCQEFHFGRAARKPADVIAQVDVDAVRRLRAILDGDSK